MRKRFRTQQILDSSTKRLVPVTLLQQRHTPFMSKNKWVVRAPSREPVSLGGLWGQGSGLGSGLRLLWAQVGWTGLDVQRGLLAREEPEHGGRHGLHVDL